MKTYHFSCGDSTHGPVGLAGSVPARTKREAVRKLRRALGELIGSFGEIKVPTQTGVLTYLNVYINPQNIRELDIHREN